MNFGCARARLERRSLHHFLDGLQGSGNGLLAGLGSAKIVLHLDEEVVRGGIRRELVGVVTFGFWAVGSHMRNSRSKSYEHNIKREVALCGCKCLRKITQLLQFGYSWL